MAKKRSSSGVSRNPGVKYSLLFALVLILLAVLLLFARGPSDGAEDVTGEALYLNDESLNTGLLRQADRSAIASDERTASESMVTCIDDDVHLGTEKYYVPSSAHLENVRTGEVLRNSRVAYDSCFRTQYLGEAKCDNGVTTYETIRCHNLLGAAAYCEEVVLDDGAVAGRCAV